MNSDTLYATHDKQGFCDQGSVSSTVLRNFVDVASVKSISFFADFLIVAKVVRSNGVKAVKIYVFTNVKRCFIGRALCSNLGLFEGFNLKINITQRQNSIEVKSK